MSQDPKTIAADFQAAVNMTAGQIKKWLDSDESKQVGYKNEGQGESVGHHSGRRIIEILGKKKADLTEADFKTTWPRSPAMSIATWPRSPSGRPDRDPLALFVDELGPRPGQEAEGRDPVEAVRPGRPASESDPRQSFPLCPATRICARARSTAFGPCRPPPARSTT